MAAGGSDGTDARDALAMERSESLLARRTPMVGACWFRLVAGALLVKKKLLAPDSAMPVCFDGHTARKITRVIVLVALA